MATDTRNGEVEDRYNGMARAETVFAIFATFGTALATSAAIALAIQEGHVDSRYLLVFGVFLFLSGVGVSLGLHRLFCHHSFVAHKSVRTALALLGISSGQGYFFRWINDHQLHHRYSDRPGDPHSPYFFGSTRLGTLHGVLHSHFLWLFRDRARFSASRLGGWHRDPVLNWFDRKSAHIAAFGILMPGGILFFFDPAPMVFVNGCLWGGCVRMFVLNHITWAVNSAGHMFGSKYPESLDESRNNALLGIIAFGDGWHANHHRDPRSARHGWKWWQFDFNWQLVSLLSSLGLVCDVRTNHRD